MSAPSANGFCSSGDMSVLSTSINAPCFLQTRARPRRSQTRCMGFVGDLGGNHQFDRTSRSTPRTKEYAS